MRPILPKEITNTLPVDIIMHIYSFVPHNEKEEKKEITVSHSYEKDLKAIQNINLKGINNMYMRGFE
jgi:queuine/archaeosine tRNA-ribosyltransferase